MTATHDLAAPARADAARPVLRYDDRGAPRISATFVLSRRPGPDERLLPLVSRAHAVIDVEASGLPSATVSAFAVVVRRGATELARTTTTGPFPQAALTLRLDAASGAGDLFAALLGTTGLLTVTVEASPTGAPEVAVAVPARLRVDLGALWTCLDAAADNTRRFTTEDLVNYLPGLLDSGAVEIDGPEVAVEEVLPALLRAASTALERVPDGGTDGDLLLAATSPGAQTVSVTLPTATTATAGTTGTVTATADLADLTGPALLPDRAAYLHVVTEDGGSLDDLLPAQRARAAPAARGALQVAAGGRLVTLASALRPEATVTAAPLRPGALALLATGPTLHRLETVETPSTEDTRPGPLVGDVAAPLWPDRFDASTAWYLPTWSVVLPDPARPASESPFHFDVTPDPGTRLDGSTGIAATIEVRLAAAMSQATQDAASAAGNAALVPVPVTALTAQLAIPFRDENGAARVELVTADEVVADGDLGAAGSSIVVRFRLLDSWARLAYGALSTPGFQAEAAAVVLTATFAGWQRLSRQPVVLGADKRWALSEFARRDAPRSGRPGTVTALTPLLASHSRIEGPLQASVIRPAWQFRPELLDRLHRVEYDWAGFSSSTRAELSLPCATYGECYREQAPSGVAGDWSAIGCRPAFQLGQTEYRTHQEITVASAVGHAKVYRSLRTPGRFLVVPARYVVARYGAEDPVRAYRPRLLLHSSVDSEAPSELLCVLAASLEPDLPPYVVGRLLAELARLHPSPTLELPTDLAVDLQTRWAAPGGTEIVCVPTPSGFDVVLTTDVAGFLALRSMLEHAGLQGSLTADLPGGVRISSLLRLALDALTGPAGTGPLAVAGGSGGGGGGGGVVLTNKVAGRIAVTGVESAGQPVAQVSAVLAPGESVTVPGLDSTPGLAPVYTEDGSGGVLDEVRAYVEDLQVAVLFLATADPGEHGLAGLEVRTRFLDHDDPEPLLLTSERREAERSYLLPLTAFAQDPVLRFTVTAVTTAGARTEAASVDWPLRTRGALVPIGPPEGATP